jgi:hypothetical protein
MTGPVKIRYWVEIVQVLPDDIEEDEFEIPREEWDAMTADERDEVCSRAAGERQDEIAPCGWEVIDE